MALEGKVSSGLDDKLTEETDSSALEEARIQLQRLATDFERFRRRAQEETREAHRLALRNFLMKLLPVIDDFETALRILDSAVNNIEIDSRHSHGLHLINRNLQKVLASSGVNRFSSEGERFAPCRHEAVEHVCSNDVPSGNVIREIVPGYEIGSEVLRPAKVVVSKGAESDEVLFEHGIEAEEPTQPERPSPL